MIIKSGALPPTLRTEPKPPSGQSPIQNPRNGFSGFLDAAIDTTFFTFNEIVEVGKNDPALALRYGATSISEKLLEGTGATVREGFGQAIIPTIRLSILGANAYRTSQTFKDPTAHLFEKGLDVARVATDLMGLAGSVLKYIAPSKAALGDTLVGASYAADSVSHAIRLMTHGVDRSVVWKKQLAERKAVKAKEPAKEVAPTPIATAPLNTSTPTYLLAK
jgi:hypothetical protein